METIDDIFKRMDKNVDDLGKTFKDFGDALVKTAKEYKGEQDGE